MVNDDECSLQVSIAIVKVFFLSPSKIGQKFAFWGED